MYTIYPSEEYPSFPKTLIALVVGRSAVKAYALH